MAYKVFRNNLGQVDAINRIADGATVPTWDEANSITIAFRAYCLLHPELDISDHSPIAIPTDPDMDSFRQGMLANSGYQRVTLAASIVGSGILAVMRLEDAWSFNQPYWSVAQSNWSVVLGLLTILNRPTSQEITSWQAVRTAANVTAISFNSSTGAIVIS